MKTLLSVSSIIIFVLVFQACSSLQNGSTARTPNEPNVIEDPGNTMTLTDRLRTVPGVSVVGYGGGAKVRIRGGNNSILADTEPLFVLNDQIIQGGFSTVFNMIDVANIERIEVLKDSSSTSAYGVRGANGVIKINLK